MYYNYYTFPIINLNVNIILIMKIIIIRKIYTLQLTLLYINIFSNVNVEFYRENLCQGEQWKFRRTSLRYSKIVHSRSERCLIAAQKNVGNFSVHFSLCFSSFVLLLFVLSVFVTFAHFFHPKTRQWTKRIYPPSFLTTVSLFQKPLSRVNC